MSNLSSNIIIYGDQSSGVDLTKSQRINKIIADMYPSYIIGTGDHEYTTTNVPKILCNGIDRWSVTGRLFAAPGNHDNDQADNRVLFNAFFGGGGYRKVTVGYIDFFLYDVYLNADEDGYLSSLTVRDISLATFQATTQGQWLLAQLAASTNTWKVVVFHQNCWTSGDNASVYHCDGMRWDWSALGVDLVLNAHQHFYERLLVDTGSGNVPIICIGNSGSQVYTGPASGDELAQSQKIISGHASSDNYDAECAYGFVNKLIPAADSLTLKIYGVDASYILREKDELVLTK